MSNGAVSEGRNRGFLSSQWIFISPCFYAEGAFRNAAQQTQQKVSSFLNVTFMFHATEHQELIPPKLEYKYGKCPLDWAEEKCKKILKKCKKRVNSFKWTHSLLRFNNV